MMRACIILCLQSDGAMKVSMSDFVELKQSKVVNPYPNFYYDLIFKLCLGLKCFRSGMRHNKYMLMLARSQTVAVLMYIGKHRIYLNLIA